MGGGFGLGSGVGSGMGGGFGLGPGVGFGSGGAGTGSGAGARSTLGTGVGSGMGGGSGLGAGVGTGTGGGFGLGEGRGAGAGTGVPSPARVAAVARASSRPLLVLLDAPEEMPPRLAHRLAEWTASTTRWLRDNGVRMVVAGRPEYWERAGALYPDGALYAPARPAPRLPAAYRLGDFTPAEAEAARARYGIPAAGVREPDGRHPLTLRLLAGVRAAEVTAGSPGRHEVFGAHLDLACLRVAVRIAAGAAPAGAVHGPGVRRLAARVAGRVHEAAQRCLGPGHGELDRASFEELFPWRTGWAPAVLTEGLVVPAGAGYRLAHEEFADWLQAAHLDVPTALDALVHRSGPGPALPVPRHRIGPVLEALLLMPPPALTPHLTALIATLDRLTEAATRPDDAALPDNSSARRATSPDAGTAPPGGAPHSAPLPGSAAQGPTAPRGTAPPGPAAHNEAPPGATAPANSGAQPGGGTAQPGGPVYSPTAPHGTAPPGAAFHRAAPPGGGSAPQGGPPPSAAPPGATARTGRAPHSAAPPGAAPPGAAPPPSAAPPGTQGGPAHSAAPPGGGATAPPGTPAHSAAAADRAWWAARLVREVLVRSADARPFLDVLHALAAHVARAGSDEFGGWFWNRLRLPEPDRLELLRRLLPADHRYLDAAARRLVRDPQGVVPLLCGWFGDERRLRGRPGATVATAAQALLHTHRRLAPDDLVEALVTAAHPRADELLAVLAEEEPSAICRAVDRWAGDERPERRVAAAAYGPAAAAHLGGAADHRMLLRRAALALLDRPGDLCLHGAALGMLLWDPEVRERHLPDALACAGVPPSALVAAAEALPGRSGEVLDALRDRADGQVLRALAALTAPGPAARAARLVREHLARHPQDAPHAAAFVDRRLDHGPAAGPLLRPLAVELLRGPVPSRAALAPVLGAVGAETSRPLRCELLDDLLGAETEPAVLAELLGAVARDTVARGEQRTRELVRRTGRRLLALPGGAAVFERRVVELARELPPFGRLAAHWLHEEPREAAALLGPSARRMVETLAGSRPSTVGSAHT
ncbi:serine protease [Streptomyces sp. NPDC051211]|uniref:serine protease n=1 Tax=Streptomyces sp. NPDC051211 TaxID=3154643 RepID=UPI00344D19DD